MGTAFLQVNRLPRSKVRLLRTPGDFAQPHPYLSRYRDGTTSGGPPNEGTGDPTERGRDIVERRDFLRRSALAGAGVALTTGFKFGTHHDANPHRKHRHHHRHHGLDGGGGGGTGGGGGGGGPQNTGAIWGAYVNPEGKPMRDAILQFEAQIGRKLGMTR